MVGLYTVVQCQAYKVYYFLFSQEGNSDGSPGFHVVLGNEACDLDSMVCALVYAYFLSKVRVRPRSPTHSVDLES